MIDNTNDKPKIGIIGAGNMGKALISGLIKNQPASHICVADPNHSQCNSLRQQWHINSTTHNSEAAKFADFLILAVKPHQIKNILIEISASLKEQTVILSIAAGITSAQLCAWLPTRPDGKTNPVIRAMPNTPALINQGITALFKTDDVTDTQTKVAEQLLSTVGQVLWIEKESLMNVVTALSGSGPAYFFYMLEALIAGATKLGLPKDLATQLAMETAKGSITMAQKSNLSLEKLREQVTSKGGTTERGLEVLSENNLFSILEQTIEQATQRGKILSEKSN